MMRTPLLAAALAIALASSDTARPLPPERDPAAVRAVLESQRRAWNRGDLEGYMAGYWRSDSLTFYSGGDVTRGWRPTLDRYVRRYRGEGREMGTLGFDLHHVDVLPGGEAIVRGGWALTTRTGRPHGLFTLWLRWFPGTGWRIVHDHSSAAP